MKLKFLGHAGFEVTAEGKTLLFDPFLQGNPLAPVKPETVNADYILVSHGHDDHLGDAVSIARRNKALIIATAELAGKCAREGAQTHAMHIGGVHEFEFGTVRITPALHGSGIPGGQACGFIVNFYGKTLYHPGDTGLFSDMALLGRLAALDVALLPIGDNYTMGIDDAVEAVKMLNPRLAVPMHYNTWPVIAADPSRFKARVEAETATRVTILEPGQETDV